MSVGIDHDTAEFAAEAIRRWWQKMGRTRYPKASELLITADGGGSNGSRCRLWKVALQKLADRDGIESERLPLPAGHEQVEQDRASPVLPHHAELARQAAGEPRGHRQPDRQHHHGQGAESQGGTRHRFLPLRNQG